MAEEAIQIVGDEVAMSKDDNGDHAVIIIDPATDPGCFCGGDCPIRITRCMDGLEDWSWIDQTIFETWAADNSITVNYPFYFKIGENCYYLEQSSDRRPDPPNEVSPEMFTNWSNDGCLDNYANAGYTTTTCACEHCVEDSHRRCFKIEITDLQLVAPDPITLEPSDTILDTPYSDYCFVIAVGESGLNDHVKYTTIVGEYIARAVPHNIGLCTWVVWDGSTINENHYVSTVDGHYGCDFDPVITTFPKTISLQRGPDTWTLSTPIGYVTIDAADLKCDDICEGSGILLSPPWSPPIGEPDDNPYVLISFKITPLQDDPGVKVCECPESCVPLNEGLFGSAFRSPRVVCIHTDSSLHDSYFYTLGQGGGFTAVMHDDNCVWKYEDDVSAVEIKCLGTTDGIRRWQISINTTANGEAGDGAAIWEVPMFVRPPISSGDNELWALVSWTPVNEGDAPPRIQGFAQDQCCPVDIDECAQTISVTIHHDPDGAGAYSPLDSAHVLHASDLGWADTFGASILCDSRFGAGPTKRWRLVVEDHSSPHGGKCTWQLDTDNPFAACPNEASSVTSSNYWNVVEWVPDTPGDFPPDDLGTDDVVYSDFPP